MAPPSRFLRLRRPARGRVLPGALLMSLALAAAAPSGAETAAAPGGRLPLPVDDVRVPVEGTQNLWFLVPGDLHPGGLMGAVEEARVGEGRLVFTPKGTWGRFTYSFAPAGGAADLAGAAEALGREGAHVQGTLTAVREPGREWEARLRLGPREVAGVLRTEAEEPNGDPVPAYRNLRYGPHWKQVFDVYRPAGAGPFPVLVGIHGGGWGAFDKQNYQREAASLLRAGVALVAISYPYIGEAKERGVRPPVQAVMHDVARALQVARHHAPALGLDPERIVLTGGSAGACTALWIGLHDDLADPASADPVARESTRVLGVHAVEPQTSLDPVQMREWIPTIVYGAHAFGIDTRGADRGFDEFLARREELGPWIAAYSPWALASADDPPVYLDFAARPNTLPATDGAHATHHPKFGEMLAARLREVGAEAWFLARDVPEPRWKGGGAWRLELLRR